MKTIEGQLTIFDIEIPAKTKSAFEIFHEHCRHRGWYRKATETEPGAHMCGYASKRLAQCWADWIPCTEENCPLLNETGGQT